MNLQTIAYGAIGLLIGLSALCLMVGVLGLITSWLLQSFGLPVSWLQASTGWFLLGTIVGLFNKQ